MPAIYPDNAFATGMAMGQRAYFDSAEAARQRDLADAQIAETQARTTGIGITNRTNQALLDQQNQERALQQSMAGRSQSGQMLDPSQQTGLSIPSQNMMESGQGGYGTGPAAVNDARGDFARENARWGVAPNATAGGAVPTVPYDPASAALDTRTLAMMRGNPAEISASQHAVQLTQASKDIQGAMKQIAKDPNAQMDITAKYIKDYPELGWTIQKGPNGFATILMPGDTPNSPPVAVHLTPSQVNGMIAGEAYLKNGLVTEGLATLQGVDTTLAARVKAHVEAATSTVGAINTGARDQATTGYQQGMLGVAAEQAATGRYSAVAGAAERAPQVVSAQGQPGYLMPNQNTGNLEYQALPQGLAFQKQADPAAIERQALMLVGQPDPANPRQPMNQMRAYEVARTLIGGGPMPGRAPLPATPPPRQGAAQGPGPTPTANVPTGSATPQALPRPAARANLSPRTMMSLGIQQNSSPRAGAPYSYKGKGYPTAEAAYQAALADQNGR